MYWKKISKLSYNIANLEFLIIIYTAFATEYRFSQYSTEYGYSQPYSHLRKHPKPYMWKVEASILTK